MSDPEGLPDTDDPLEFFAVDWDADERTLKRAYTRLIRRFRPEQRPAEFQRIRAMYEQAQEWFAGRNAEGPGSDGWEEALDPDEPATDEAPLPSGLRVAWEHVAEGRSTEAITELETLASIQPEDAAAWIHAFLVHEALGKPFADAVQTLLTGLATQAASAGVARWVTTTLDPDELEQLARIDTIPWELHADRDASAPQAQLFRQRVHALLRRGEAGAVFDLLAQPVVRDAAFHGAFVRLVTLEAVCYGLWSAEPRALELYEELVAEVDPTQSGGDEDSALEACLHVEWATRSWRDSHVAQSAPSALLQFLATRAIFEDDAAQEPVRELAHQLAVAPDAYFRAVSNMIELAPQAHVYLRNLIGAPLPEESDDDDDDDEDEPETEPLTASQQDAVEEFAQLVDPQLDKSTLGNLMYVAVLLILAGVVASFFFIGWWGLLGLPVGFFLWGFVWYFGDSRLYAKFVRMPLARTVAEVGARPRQVAAWLEENDKQFTKIDGLTSEIKGDKTVTTLAELAAWARSGIRV